MREQFKELAGMLENAYSADKHLPGKHDQMGHGSWARRTPEGGKREPEHKKGDDVEIGGAKYTIESLDYKSVSGAKSWARKQDNAGDLNVMRAPDGKYYAVRKPIAQSMKGTQMINLNPDNFLDVTAKVWSSSGGMYDKTMQATSLTLDRWQSPSGDNRRVYVNAISGDKSYRNGKLVVDPKFSGNKLTIGYIDKDGYHPATKGNNLGQTNTKYLWEQRAEMITLGLQMLEEWE
jgi:hypothetical protein